mgnify:CR=1 FL=1
MSTENPRHTLLSITGLSPQVVTETLYGIHKQGLPWPNELIILTTRQGAEQAQLGLCCPTNQQEHNILAQCCIDLKRPQISDIKIEIIPDHKGNPIDDARSREDQEALADYIVKRVARLCADPQCTTLHASLAGGRKTMTFFLGYAMSLFARPNDRLSHVLINPVEYEGLRDFYYPTSYTNPIIGRNPNQRLDTHEDKVQVMLADIPFIRQRDQLEKSVLVRFCDKEEQLTYRQLVQLQQLASYPDAKNEIQNIGTGQIYGDHIALQTAHLLNAEQQTSEGVKAGTIAARQRLDIAGGKIENREQALIASEGTLTVGGQLNVNHMAEGSAASLDNASARIQSVGDMYLGVDTLTNRNLHFSSSVKEIPETRKDVTAYQGAGSAEILDSSHITGHGSHDTIYLDGQKYEDYTRYIYNQYETKHYVDSSAPAEIISGGALTLKGQSLTNDKSQILAAKGITIEQNEVNNIDAEGEHRVIKNGTSQYHYVGWNSLGTSKKSEWNGVRAYNPADIVTPIKLDVVKYDGAHQGGLNGDTSELSLPLQSLYSVNKENNNRPLIESSDAFTNYKKWLGSDYMLQMFATDPQNMQKRLGDGYYEQKLVNDQIAQLTGQVYLDGYTNFENQFKALMDSGVSAAKDLNLSVGVKLSEAQIARLTSDMVWLVTETITVDGEKIQVLVPKVYVAVQPGDLNNKGALIAGETVNLKLSGDLNNQGSIAGRQLVNLEANNMNNVGGLIQGRDVFATAHTDINNIGGTMTANQTLALDAGRDINNITTTIKTENQHGLSEFSAENIGRVAGLYVQDADGQLVANAKNNINLTASDLQSQGSIAIQAGQDLNLSTVNVSRSDLSSAGDKDQILNASSRDVGTQIQAKGNISLQSGANTQIKASTLNSTSGNVVIDAGQNVLIENGRDERSSQLAAQEKGGFSTTDKKIQSSTSQSIATDIQSGGNILINSQTADIQATHLQAGAKDSIQITANQGNVKLLSDIDTDMKSTETAKKNTIQFKNRQSGYIDEDVAQTQLKAGKNVDINAGKNIELQANDIQAQDNIYIGNTQFERQADGSLKSKDGNALPENVSLTTLETNDQQWDETQKGYRGIAKDLMKVTAVGLAGIEALAPGLKAPKITIGESSSTRTEQRTQTGTDLGANNVYVGSAGQTTLTSSNIDAQNTVLAGKKVTLDAAEEQHKTVTSNSKETVQGLGVKLNKDSIRVGGFVLEDAENTVKTTATTHKSGNINTENLTIQGAEGVDLLGQNITATGDTIIDYGRGNLNIGGYENKTTTEEKTHTETISTEVGIRNAYVDAALAIVAVKDAISALKDAKDDYSQAQRNYASGKITKEALDDSKANVAMATANVATAQIAAAASAAAVAAAAASSYGTGFTIGANGERIETTTTTNTEQSQWQGSNLDLNNLQLKSEGQDINIQGSRVNATGTTTFDGSKDLNVTAGVEHSKQDSNSKTNSQSVSYTYGGGGSASIGKQTSQSQNESLTHVNSEVVLNRTEGAIDKLNIQGGTVSIADRGNLQVKEIHVESLQDTASSSNSSKGGSIGGGYGSGSKNITASYNQAKGNSDSAWVNDTSKLLIGNAQNDADLDAMGVKNVTNIGGVIANATKNSDGTLTDHGKLNYSGELELKDIEDHNYNSSSGFNVSTSIGIPQKGTPEASTAPKGSTTIGLNSSGQETEQLTKATMGQGTVTNAIDSTNRDINNTQEITRDQVTGMLDGSVTVDHRLLSESGRAEIIQEQKDLAEDIESVATDLLALGVNTAVKLGTGVDVQKIINEVNRIESTLNTEDQAIFKDLIAAQVEDNRVDLESNAAPIVVGGAVAAYCAKNPVGCAKVIEKTAQALAAIGITIGMNGEEKKETHPKGVPSTSGNSATGMPPNGDDLDDKNKAVNDILKNAKLGRETKGKTTQYEKNGGFNQANKEFNNLGLTNIREIPNIGRVGQLKDGTKVVVRNKSSDGRPTLEIQSSPKKIEIRYNP